MTLQGLFLDPRTWTIDYLTSPFWKPEKFGVNIDLHQNAFHIPKTGLKKKYDFVLTTEVWEIPIRKTLHYLRNKGLKVILVPREVAPGKSHLGTMFAEDRYEWNGSYFFNPDIVLSPGERYHQLWEGKTKRRIIGYPRFDICLRPDLWKSKNKILERHGIEKGKKIIFFPSYPPYHVETTPDGKSVMRDLYKDLESTMAALEAYALKHKDEVQVVVKIHPSAFKCWRKNMGVGNEVIGRTLKYYKNPTKYMKVIGDIRNDSSVAREMIIAADAVVGYTSMMLLESIVMKKPIVHVKFTQTRGVQQAIDFSKEMFTILEPEEMEDAIDRALHTDELLIDIKDSWLFEHCLYKTDGKFCERLCDGIKSVF